MKKLMILTTGFLLFAGSQICGCGTCTRADVQSSSLVNYTKSEPKTITLKVTGMTCGGCSNSIHKALSENSGILDNEVKYPGNVAIIKYDPEKISVKEIIEIIEKAGYEATLINETEKSEIKEKI